MNNIDSEKIIENMKAVLKATKKPKSKKKKRHKKSDNNSEESSADEAIADLMTKNWKMRSPNVEKKVQKSPPKVKVNAFEKLMSNSKKIEISPEVQQDGSQKKQKRKYTKRKNKNQETEHERIDPESDLSMLDEESLINLSKRRSGNNTAPTAKSSPTLNGIQKFFNVKQQSPSTEATQTSNTEEIIDDEDIKTTRKRNRGKETNLNISIPDENTPKRRRKIKEDKVLLDSNENVEEIDLSQSGRPKRSCANKINYSFLESPDKQSPEKKKSRRRRIASSDEDSSFAVIEIDENSPIKEQRKNVKLAPLFVKKIPKPAIDPAVTEARRNFLFSTELPSNLRATIDKQKQLDDEILSNDLVAFPLISHITQLNFDRNNFEDISSSKIKFKEILDDDFEYKLQPLTRGRFTDYCNELSECDPISYDQPSPEDIKQIVRKIKDSSGNFPVNRLFKQLLRKHKDATTNSSEISFQNSLFIDIFKPSTSDEYLMAQQPIEELKKFLTTWNERNNKDDDDYDSDSNSRSSFKGSMCNNYIVLSGNNGVGKTSSVYALANDLNYEVIEINAGSRRSGKKMLQDLYEATQSHRVEKRTEDSNSEQLEIDKRTIILIEDAEIAFDSDDGFISSIQQLINITKRPVILTTNNRECPHLQRFIQYNEIIYQSPQSSMITKYLTLLCLATASTYQHRRIDETDIERLYSLNEYDLRKTINEIEFFIRSDGNSSKRSGNLLKIYGNHHQRQNASNKKPTVGGRKDLARRCFESSILSSYSSMISTFERHEHSEELSHHSSNIMNEIADYFDHHASDFHGDFEKGGFRREIKVKSSIYDDLNVISGSGNVSKRANAVDFSPLLRQICRSEKNREKTSRRTSRNHYLRFMPANNSLTNDYFNAQCETFQQDES